MSTMQLQEKESMNSGYLYVPFKRRLARLVAIIVDLPLLFGLSSRVSDMAFAGTMLFSKPPS